VSRKPKPVAQKILVLISLAMTVVLVEGELLSENAE
jgi:hypothetical protein